MHDDCPQRARNDEPGYVGYQAHETPSVHELYERIRWARRSLGGPGRLVGIAGWPLALALGGDLTIKLVEC